MPAVNTRIVGITAAGIVAASLMTSAALATPSSANLTITMSSAAGTFVFDPADYGNSWDNGNKTFGYSGQTNGSGWGLGWSLLVNPDPFVIANLVVTNTTLVDQEFTLTVTMPVPPGYMDTTIGGSVTGTVTDLNGNGASLSAVAGGSIYSALIDNAVVATLLDNHSTIVGGAFESGVVGPAAFGDLPEIPSQPGPDALVNIGITLRFVLSAGDAASFTSIFVLFGTEIPAPGALAMLGLAGLCGRGRRRKA